MRLLAGRKAVLFDLDGTLIDSIGVWNEVDDALIDILGGPKIADIQQRRCLLYTSAFSFTFPSRHFFFFLCAQPMTSAATAPAIRCISRIQTNSFAFIFFIISRSLPFLCDTLSMLRARPFIHDILLYPRAFFKSNYCFFGKNAVQYKRRPAVRRPADCSKPSSPKTKLRKREKNK